jgi:hypothetical protein
MKNEESKRQLRRSRKRKFEVVKKGAKGLKGKEYGSLKLAAIQVNRWPWPDAVIFSTWRDQQREFFAGQRRVMWAKRMIVGGGLIVLAAIIRILIGG